MSILFVLFLFPQVTGAQIGFWEVETVIVDLQKMTPQAKWFQIKENGEVLSGNSSIINTWGFWEMADSNLLFFDQQKNADAYGALLVEENQEKMSWSRMEDGANVKVYLILAEQYPLAPWDQLLGEWQLTSYSFQGEELTLLSEDVFLRFRWDHLYRGEKVTETLGLRRGIWHYDGHRPILRTISEAGDAFDHTWQVKLLTENKMVLEEGEQDQGYSLTLER